MEVSQLFEYGITGIAIGAIVFVVLKFLAHLKEKDKDFKEIITNHLSHSNGILEKLDNAVRELIVWVKRANGKK